MHTSAVELGTFTNGLSSQGRRALWNRDMGVEEERGNTKVAGQIFQNGFRGSKKHTRLYLEIRSGKAKCGNRDKKKGS